LWLRSPDHPAQPGQQCGGQCIERLIGAHQVEIVVGSDPGDRHNLIEHAAMLRRNAHAHAKSRVGAQGMDHRKHLDRLRTGAEDDEDGLAGRLGDHHAVPNQVRLTPG